MGADERFHSLDLDEDVLPRGIVEIRSFVARIHRQLLSAVLRLECTDLITHPLSARYLILDVIQDEIRYSNEIHHIERSTNHPT